MAAETLTKTLTFGLGKIKGYDVRTKKLLILEDATRETIYKKILPSCFQEFARVCNFTTSLLYVSKILRVEIEKLGYNTGYTPILEQLNMNTRLNGKALNQAWGLAKAHFTGEHGKKLMRNGETSLPTHRADGTHPLYFHKDAVRLHREDDSFFIVYNLFSDKWAKSENFPSWVAFQVKLKSRDRTGYRQLEKVLAGEWEHGSGQLSRNRRDTGPKYIMRLVVKYVPEPYKTLVKETVMGIDLGISIPAAIHFRDPAAPLEWAMCMGNGRAMLNARGVVRGEITRLLRALKRKDSPLQGNAREAANEKLRKLRRQEQRILKTASQKIAAQIADQARRNGAGTWQMEDLHLTDMKEGKPWMARNWAAGTLIDAIKWQARQLGVEMILVNPKYTSQRCSKCGRIDRENRPKGKKGASYFKCTGCGYEDHADKNAARNLSIPGIHKIIEKEISMMV